VIKVFILPPRAPTRLHGTLPRRGALQRLFPSLPAAAYIVSYSPGFERLGLPFTIHVWALGTLANRCGPPRLTLDIHDRRVAGDAGGGDRFWAVLREALHGLCPLVRCSNDSTQHDWTGDPRDGKAAVLQVGSQHRLRKSQAKRPRDAGFHRDRRQGGAILIYVLWQTATPTTHRPSASPDTLFETQQSRGSQRPAAANFGPEIVDLRTAAGNMAKSWGGRVTWVLPRFSGIDQSDGLNSGR
jgi:hypothetical protein